MRSHKVSPPIAFATSHCAPPRSPCPNISLFQFLESAMLAPISVTLLLLFLLYLVNSFLAFISQLPLPSLTFQIKTDPWIICPPSLTSCHYCGVFITRVLSTSTQFVPVSSIRFEVPWEQIVHPNLLIILGSVPTQCQRAGNSHSLSEWKSSFLSWIFPVRKKSQPPESVHLFFPLLGNFDGKFFPVFRLNLSLGNLPIYSCLCELQN